VNPQDHFSRFAPFEKRCYSASEAKVRALARQEAKGTEISQRLGANGMDGVAFAAEDHKHRHSTGSHTAFDRLIASACSQS
jgi:hypothetical protein